MKKLKLFLSCCVVSAIASYATAALADGKCDANQVYCVITTGSQPDNDGRYVKITFSGKQPLVYPTLCLNDSSTLESDQKDIRKGEAFFNIGTGSNTYTFDQCKDKTCSDTKNVGKATFTLNGTYPNFVATPPTDSFSLDHTYGDKCSPGKVKFQMQNLK